MFLCLIISLVFCGTGGIWEPSRGVGCLDLSGGVL